MGRPGEKINIRIKRSSNVREREDRWRGVNSERFSRALAQTDSRKTRCEGPVWAKAL